MQIRCQVKRFFVIIQREIAKYLNVVAECLHIPALQTPGNSRTLHHETCMHCHMIKIHKMLHTSRHLRIAVLTSKRGSYSKSLTRAAGYSARI